MLLSNTRHYAFYTHYAPTSGQLFSTSSHKTTSPFFSSKPANHLRQGEHSHQKGEDVDWKPLLRNLKEALKVQTGMFCFIMNHLHKKGGGPLMFSVWKTPSSKLHMWRFSMNKSSLNKVMRDALHSEHDAFLQDYDEDKAEAKKRGKM